MFFCFFLFFLIKWPISLFFLLLLQSLDFSHFLRQYMIIIFCFEFISIKGVDGLVDDGLSLFYFFISFVDNIGVSFNFLLDKFDHQHSVLARFPIEQHDTMRIDRLIENNVLDLSPGFAIEIS